MKKSVSIIILLFLCSFHVVQAQISESGYWYNGRITYSAKSMPGGRVVMYAMDEGEARGSRQKALETARLMKEENCEISFIQKMTGLSRDEVENV